MSGFVGFINRKKQKENIIIDMSEKIVHRGPNFEGFHIDDDINIAFRKISSESVKGKLEPYYNNDKTKLIILDGNIYNKNELQDDLIKKGYKFKTNNDEEILLNYYEEYGEKTFEKLRGSFSFIIYNLENKEIIGVRDFFGSKPFYYYHEKDNFIFGSEIKSFLPHPDFKKELNKKSLKMYLVFQYSVFDETFFKNVYKLKPGHYFTYKNGELTTTQYFSINYQKVNDSYLNMRDNLEKIINESINNHQVNDREIGTYLSGGVDSSYVTSVVRPKKSFSVGFDKEGFDETMYAKELSESLKIDNHQKYISPDEFFDILPTVQYHTDEPHANLSTVPLYFLSKIASKHVNVILAGEGADEMFAGYNEYNDSWVVKSYLKIPSSIRRGMANVAKSIPSFKGKNSIIKLAKPFHEQYIGPAYVMSADEANEIMAKNLENNQTIYDVVAPVLEKVEKSDSITKKMYLDMHFWLPRDILLKADKMSMANSIELRTPLLDKYLFDYASTIPNNYLVKNKQTKYIFRDIALKELPDDWAKRKKLGFPVPFSNWIREEKYYNLIKDTFNQDFVSEFFKVDKINQLLDDHFLEIKNNGRKIYNIYVFLIWYQRYFND